MYLYINHNFMLKLLITNVNLVYSILMFTFVTCYRLIYNLQW